MNEQNHQHSDHPHEEPERQSARADDLDPTLLEDALHAMRRYAEQHRAPRAAFLAYLDLDLDLQLDPSVNEEADFRERYVGSYDNRSAFIRDRIRQHGWAAALASFQNEQGMWPTDLQWDEGVLWEHLSDLYTLVERAGGIHAFRD